MSAEGRTKPPRARFNPRLSSPSLKWERALWRSGLRLVAGLDEVGRGPLAGPVVAAAVALPCACGRVPWLRSVRDSKLLSARQRETLDVEIRATAVAIGIGAVSAADLDVIGIVEATRLAMSEALSQFEARAEHLLIDALSLSEPPIPQTPLVHGDARCVSIACASIVAKVARDRMMVDLDRSYPGYGFVQNKGYGTPQHLLALKILGPSPIHRRSFAPVRLSSEVEA
jgi:ribonuclease HII